MTKTKRRTINKTFYAHGKLLLTGEYAVLDGAKALAIPTKRGQQMTVKKCRGSDLIWECLDEDGKVWFKSIISIMDFSPLETTDKTISAYVTKLLKNSVRLNSEFLSKWNGFRIETKLEFPRNWGLGSSSTITHLVAEWADVHPLMLAFKSSNGSGYDVACAGAEGPIVFQSDMDAVSYTPINFDPSFKENIYFIHLKQKKNTNDAIKFYHKHVKNKKQLATSLSQLTESIIECKDLNKFENLIDEHESILGKALGFKPIKSSSFKDFWGSIKSLGAWGGDFIMVSSSKSDKETRTYFETKGYDTILNYHEMVL